VAKIVMRIAGDDRQRGCENIVSIQHGSLTPL
jgi:hypothetical protein